MLISRCGTEGPGTPQRIGLISDIHGNQQALDGVLQAIEADGGVDELWVMGDLVAGGPDPAAVASTLAGRPGTRVMLGNTDRRVLAVPTLASTRKRHEPPLVGPVSGDAWTLAQLEAKGLVRWFRGLPRRIEKTVGDAHIVAVHASPHRDDGRGITPDLSDPELRDLLREAKADVLVAGHTHVPFARRLGQRCVINVGSVSHQVDGSDGRASYCVLTLERESTKVLLRSASYDRAEVAERLRAVRHPEAELLVQRFFRVRCPVRRDSSGMSRTVDQSTAASDGNDTSRRRAESEQTSDGKTLSMIDALAHRAVEELLLELGRMPTLTPQQKAMISTRLFRGF